MQKISKFCNFGPKLFDIMMIIASNDWKSFDIMVVIWKLVLIEKELDAYRHIPEISALKISLGYHPIYTFIIFPSVDRFVFNSKHNPNLEILVEPIVLFTNWIHANIVWNSIILLTLGTYRSRVMSRVMTLKWHTSSFLKNLGIRV